MSLTSVITNILAVDRFLWRYVLPWISRRFRCSGERIIDLYNRKKYSQDFLKLHEIIQRICDIETRVDPSGCPSLLRAIKEAAESATHMYVIQPSYCAASLTPPKCTTLYHSKSKKPRRSISWREQLVSTLTH